MEAKRPRKDAAGAGGRVGTARTTRIGVLVRARVGHRTGIEVEIAACTGRKHHATSCHIANCYPIEFFVSSWKWTL